MPDLTHLARTVRRELTALADSATQESMQRLIPGAKILGVSVPNVRQLTKTLSAEHADLTPEQLIDLLDRLCESGVREEMLVGIFWLGRKKKTLPMIPWPRIDHWVDALDNWETCDQLATHIIGPIVASDIKHVDRLMRWTSSPHLWRRRCVLATAVQLNQKGRAHPEIALRLCEPLLNDPEVMVTKAIGWALRVATSHNETAVFEFLKNHARGIPKSVLREGSEKLSAGHRNSILKSLGTT